MLVGLYEEGKGLAPCPLRPERILRRCLECGTAELAVAQTIHVPCVWLESGYVDLYGLSGFAGYHRRLHIVHAAERAVFKVVFRRLAEIDSRRDGPIRWTSKDDGEFLR